MFIGQGPTGGSVPGGEGRLMFIGNGATRAMAGEGLNGAADADSFLDNSRLASHVRDDAAVTFR